MSIKNGDDAYKIAKSLMESRLANHINIVHNNDCLIWNNDQIEYSTETILFIKTQALLYKKVEEAIQELSLSSPAKIFSVPITQIDFNYLNHLIYEILKV